DFQAEAEEVRRDQGDVFPYTMGFYLLCELVAAMNPDDLDALDDSIPLTKWVLDNLLGVVSSEQDYSRYFQGFINAQLSRKVETPLDNVKKQQNWQACYPAFLQEKISRNIPAVQVYKELLGKMGSQEVMAQMKGLRV